MGKRKAHKNGTKLFSELNHEERAKSISASINNLQKSILYHASNSSNKTTTVKTCLKQVARLSERLIEKLLLVFLCFIVVQGCSNNEQTKDDPVASFSNFSKLYMDILTKEYSNGQGDAVAASAKFFGEQQIDVKATDSLVSPYKGTIITKCQITKYDNSRYNGTINFHFDYKDNSWVYSGSSFDGSFTMGNATFQVDGAAQLDPYRLAEIASSVSLKK